MLDTVLTVDTTEARVDADLSRRWRDRRLATDVVYLDNAAAGRSSRAVLEATTAHLHREAEVGAYAAAQEARPLIDRGRADLGVLLGRRAADIAYVESASAAIRALLDAWPAAAGGRVLATPGEYGPNLDLFRAHGLVPALIPVADDLGHADVDAFTRLLDADPPGLVHLCAIGSHRGVVQPVHALVRACRERGVPVVVDAAQALGHVDAAYDADAVYATGRKWLAGPRGVGFLALRPDRAGRLRADPVAPGSAMTGADATAAGRLESREAFVGGRVGFAVAVREHLEAGPATVRAALRDVGRHARERLAGVGGWGVVEGVEEPSATTTLTPPAGWSDDEVDRARDELRTRHRVVVTYAGPERAPAEAVRATLRVSPHLDTTEEDLDVLAAALDAVTGGSRSTR